MVAESDGWITDRYPTDAAKALPITHRISSNTGGIPRLR
jgi:hypothetical protein